MQTETWAQTNKCILTETIFETDGNIPSKD